MVTTRNQQKKKKQKKKEKQAIESNSSSQSSSLFSEYRFSESESTMSELELQERLEEMQKKLDRAIETIQNIESKQTVSSSTVVHDKEKVEKLQLPLDVKAASDCILLWESCLPEGTTDHRKAQGLMSALQNWSLYQHFKGILPASTVATLSYLELKKRILAACKCDSFSLIFSPQPKRLLREVVRATADVSTDELQRINLIIKHQTLTPAEQLHLRNAAGSLEDRADAICRTHEANNSFDLNVATATSTVQPIKTNNITQPDPIQQLAENVRLMTNAISNYQPINNKNTVDQQTGLCFYHATKQQPYTCVEGCKNYSIEEFPFYDARTKTFFKQEKFQRFDTRSNGQSKFNRRRLFNQQAPQDQRYQQQPLNQQDQRYQQQPFHQQMYSNSQQLMPQQFIPLNQQYVQPLFAQPINFAQAQPCIQPL
jgi:hypothetical protein